MKLNVNEIKVAMANAEMNIPGLADKMNISKATVNAAIKRGTCSCATVGKLAKALSVDVKEIVIFEA